MGEVRWVSIAMPLLVFASMVRSQVNTSPDSLKTENSPSADTIRSTVNPPPNIVPKDVRSKSPGLAVLYSALLPGAGQLYNESYWKVPIVFGFGVYLASEWLQNNRRYLDYRDQFQRSITPEFPNGNSRLLALREFYKDQRDTFTWYLAILYFVNLLDAYVDASLYGFSVSDDLSLRLMPGPNARLTLRVTF